MRFEGQDSGRPVRGARPVDGLADHLAVAEVDAVEVADGDHGSIEPIEARTLVAHDDEGAGRVGFGHSGKILRASLDRRRQRYVNRYGRDTGPGIVPV
jgi:hypothetical protein